MQGSPFIRGIGHALFAVSGLLEDALCAPGSKDPPFVAIGIDDVLTDVDLVSSATCDLFLAEYWLRDIIPTVVLQVGVGADLATRAQLADVAVDLSGSWVVEQVAVALGGVGAAVA